MSVEPLVTTLVVVATPGTGVLYTVAAGLARGGQASVVAAVRDHVISRPRVLTWVRRLFGGAFVALGARLAFAQR